MVTERTMQVSKGGKQPIILPSYDVHNQNNDQRSVISPGVQYGAHTAVVTKGFRIGLKAHTTGVQSCLVLENPVNNPGLVKSQIMVENPSLSLYQTTYFLTSS